MALYSFYSKIPSKYYCKLIKEMMQIKMTFYSSPSLRSIPI
jgi:hypothetical protein